MLDHILHESNIMILEDGQSITFDNAVYNTRYGSDFQDPVVPTTAECLCH